MILITGATGELGSRTIDHLLKKGIHPSQISALVRDPEKAKVLAAKGVEVRLGDYSDYDSLKIAFQNVDKLLLISSNDRAAVENRTAHHIAVIEAAKEAGVQHLVYTSFVRKPGFENSAIAAFQNSHVQTEEFLKSTGINYTILQNGIYLEMIPVFAGNAVADKGVIVFPAGAGKASYVLRDELAEAAAHVLMTDRHENQVYELTNTTSVSFHDVAQAISGVTGKDVVYQSPGREAFDAMMRQSGIPEVYIGMFVMWATALQQGTMDSKGSRLADFLKREPAQMKDFIAGVYSGKSTDQLSVKP